MTNLDVPPDCLAVFIDDTGHELLAKDHPVYGLGGCAALGAQYTRLIVQPWRKVRAAVTGSPNEPLHAHAFGRHSTEEQKKAMAQFFQDYPFMRFGVAGSTATRCTPEISFMRTVVESLKPRVVEVAKFSPLRSMAVIFESNERVNNLIQEYFGSFQLQENGTPIPVEFYFMPKDAKEPGLEVADFVANALGGQVRRRSVTKKEGFQQDFQAIFHKVDRRLVSFFGIESVEPSAPPAQSPSDELTP